MPTLDSLSVLQVDENDELHVTEVKSRPPIKLYRKTIGLSFALSTASKGIAVDVDSAKLLGTFSKYDYNALTFENAGVSVQGKALIVELNALREVRKIRLDTAYPSHCLEVYRLDGSVLSSKPTVTAEFNGDTVTLPESGEVFKDTRFAVMVRDLLANDGDPVPLTTQDLKELGVRSFPTGPRMGLCDPAASDDSAVFFWQVPGEVSIEDAASGEIDAGEEMAKALETYLGDKIDSLGAAGTPQPASLIAQLIIESDAPCVLEVDDFHLVYRPILNPRLALAGSDKVSSKGKDEIRDNGKVILRYAGDQIASKYIVMKVPANAAIVQATVETVESFHSGSLVSAYDAQRLENDIGKKNEGILVASDKWTAQRVENPGASKLSGVLLGMMSLSDKTELIVELQEEWNKKPSGKVVAHGLLKLGNISDRRWQNVRFSKSVSVSPSAHWIVVTATTGKAVWLSEPGNTSVLVLHKQSRQSTYQIISEIDARKALYIFSSIAPLVSRPPPCTVSIGTDKTSDATEKDGRKTFDIAAALEGYIQEHQGDGDDISVPLTFTSGMSGIVTVYPPEIVYDVP